MRIVALHLTHLLVRPVPVLNRALLRTELAGPAGTGIVFEA